MTLIPERQVAFNAYRRLCDMGISPETALDLLGARLSPPQILPPVPPVDGEVA